MDWAQRPAESQAYQALEHFEFKSPNLMVPMVQEQTGDWKDGMRSGVGYSHEVVSEIYDGEWENNMRNGYGQHFMDNQIIACIWKNNKKNGYGQIELVDKGRYVINCKWKDDKIVEPGIEVIPVRKSKRTNN